MRTVNEMMTAEQLKASILQLAMQGKLVEQRAEEGTGEELFRAIQIKKLQLIKTGRVKKDRNFVDDISEDVPFDIPNTWKWIKFGSVMNVVSARRVHQSDWKTEGIPFYRAREIAKLAEYGTVDNELFISQELYDELSKSGVPQPGDLMVTGVGTLGKTYIVGENDHFYYKDASVLCFENYADLSPEFIKLLMESPSMKEQIKSNSSGTTVATLTMVRMAEYLVPLPPLEEQKRIVAKIEKLMPFVEQYAKASTRLNTLNASFPDQMKKSILQQAVMGKLVPQDPNDEPASVLLKKIAEEKQKLIKDGKIKKQKALPAITEDEIPFDIPESWEWVRLQQICTKLTDGSHNPPPKVTIGYRVISAKNVKDGKIVFCDDDRLADQKGFDKENPRTNISSGDVILGIIGGSIGNTAIYDHEDKVIAQRSIAIIRGLIPSAYLRLILDTPLVQNQLKSNSSGSAQGGVYLGTLANLLIPIPPIEEQFRVLDSLAKLLSLTETIKQN